MKTKKLGTTDIDVSLICLGTMTWGVQNTQSQAHEQMDYALSEGVNFWDTAEMYPVPPTAETQGRTEEHIGTWFAKTGKRSDVVLASKISPMPYIREEGTRFNAKHISQALDNNLKRLQTDYIDLYQLHWPERQTTFFGKRGYTNALAEQDLSTLTPFLETIQALEDEIKKGRIRAYGLSNDTPWSTMRYITTAEANGLSKPVSIQNPYNLLNRTYEYGMAEIAHRENVGLLAYSPLAFGVLSGKYLNDAKPENARLTLFDRFSRYSNPQAISATEKYAEIAKKHGLDFAQMALAFVNSRHFTNSNIIGATSIEQLKSNIESAKLELSTEILEEIDAVHESQPNPSP